jgi:dipeptidyl-peptidase III
VNLGNVYGTPNRENVLYLNETDKDLFVKCYKPSLFVIVALHELLGHGTGKLF